ncbi:hypothetical protein ACLOJK_012761 [Asimina triloba]
MEHMDRKMMVGYAVLRISRPSQRKMVDQPWNPFHDCDLMRLAFYTCIYDPRSELSDLASKSMVRAVGSCGSGGFLVGTVGRCRWTDKISRSTIADQWMLMLPKSMSFAVGHGEDGLKGAPEKETGGDGADYHKEDGEFVDPLAAELVAEPTEEELVGKGAAEGDVVDDGEDIRREGAGLGGAGDDTQLSTEGLRLCDADNTGSCPTSNSSMYSQRQAGNWLVMCNSQFYPALLR